MNEIKRRRSLTEGPLFWRIFLFALPIMATGILQVLYNMADNIIVGRFSGDPAAVGSVGSTSSLTNLVLNLLIGISVGTSVVVSQNFGAKNEKVVSRTVHTSLTFALLGGIVFMIIGLVISSPALRLIGTEEEYLEKATLYFRIICIGIPATSLYNFGAAVIRSVGDSKTPLLILASTGIVNVLFNLLFVIAFKMGVAGVAVATIISQYLSAVWVFLVLLSKRRECYGFSFAKYAFDFALLRRILRFGVPSGIQSSVFSLSNLVLTSAVNSIGIITSYTIAANLDAITYTSCNSFHQAALTFTGQNYGAGKYDRIKKTIIYSLVQVIIVGVTVGQVELLFSRQISSLYIDANNPAKEEILDVTKRLLDILLNTYFICGIMDVLLGLVKGIGYALLPMIISITSICGVRIFWIYVVFPLPQFHTPEGIVISYAISWSTEILLILPILIVGLRRVKRELCQKAKENVPEESSETA